jgi:hypothetical protein
MGSAALMIKASSELAWLKQIRVFCAKNKLLSELPQKREVVKEEINELLLLLRLPWTS